MRTRYLVDHHDFGRWIEAGDIVAESPRAAVQALAKRPGNYRARPEGEPERGSKLFRVQESGRAVPVEVL
jgi:hypothetical protein